MDGQGLSKACVSPWRIKYCMPCSEKLGEVGLPCSEEQKGALFRRRVARSCPAARSGEIAPRQGASRSGAPCPAAHGGGDGKLCFTRGPQHIGSSRCPPRSAGQTQKLPPPPPAAACPPGVLLPTALGYMYFVFNLAEPSAASSCFQMFLSASHPAWLPSSKYWGQDTPRPVPQGCPGGTRQPVCTIAHSALRLRGGPPGAGCCEPSLCFTIPFLPL